MNDQFQELMDAAHKAHPKLAEKLYEKYEQDREAFIAFVDKHAADKDDSYWAKGSCKKCYGTAIIGTRDGLPVRCSCVIKNYSKWIKLLRVEYNLQRSK